MSEHHEGSGLGHVQSVKTLAIILVALLVLTWLTYVTGSANLQGWDLSIAMIIATFKASLVALFFMHLKYDRPLHGTVFLFAVVFVGIFLAYVVGDSHEYQHYFDEHIEDHRQ